MIWRWLACAPSVVPGTEVPAADLGPLRIATLASSCDVDDGQWQMTVETTGWSGGGTTDWTVDGAYVERHRVDVVRYAEDRSSETLELTLAVVSDWRDQAAQRSTAFTCAEDVSIVFVLLDLDGVQVDCRTLGPEAARWAEIEGSPACDIPWTADR